MAPMHVEFDCPWRTRLKESILPTDVREASISSGEMKTFFNGDLRLNVDCNRGDDGGSVSIDDNTERIAETQATEGKEISWVLSTPRWLHRTISIPREASLKINLRGKIVKLRHVPIWKVS